MQTTLRLIAVMIFTSGMFIPIAANAAEGALDYGLYWFDENNNSVKAVEANGKVNRVHRSFYDPKKPTIVHFHGWQPASGILGREDFNFKGIITSRAWKEKGWNIAYFYWDQFANELEVKHAEAKMWSINGPRGMRYKKSDGSYSTQNSPNKPIGQIAFEQVTAALAGNSSNYVRLSGHSLGSQLATIVAGKISDAVTAGTVGNNVLVDRLELLDPFFSKYGKDYLGDTNSDGYDDWTGEHVRWTVQTLINRHGIPVAGYYSSNINDLWIGDKNNGLRSMITEMWHRYWYLADEINKHNHVVPNYFRSMASAPPEEVTINWWGQRSKTGRVAASASTSDSRVKAMMGNTYYWDQVEGRYTSDPADDQFEIKNY